MSFKKIIFISCLLFSFVAFADENAVRTTPLKGTVALTFDDGPNPTFTPQILAILKKYDVKATFFMVGMEAKQYPDVVKQIKAEGHKINSHSQTHPLLTKLSDDKLRWEVNTPSDIIQQIVGDRPHCLRYPFGASNEHVRTVIRQAGMVPVPMGFNSFDYERPGTEKIVSWVLKNAHSGTVILLHDGFNHREQTVAALPKIIEGVKQKGLGFSQICV